MAQIDNLPPLREVVQTYGLMAKKSLGQNFLFDLNLTSRIARAGGPLEGKTVVEVGPGPGGLTRAILAAGVQKLIVIERDSRCLPALQEISDYYPGKLEIIEGDALEIDPRALLNGRPARIISNLPYNVGTVLLTNWVSNPDWPPWWESMTLMFQKEVAERIVADESDTSNYGRLAVLCGWRTEAHILFDVPPTAFVPPPKVTSSIVHLKPRQKPQECSIQSLEAVARAAFGQRRKMLRQSLKSFYGDAQKLLEAAGIEPTARAEDIPVSAYVELANTFDRLKK
ncbi:16S rRNA (adenine(1518)-N(6)/adenine(1519)-N(6))-dimethyltransferase RsmA [Microvirga sp. W0021]|uniref:Ribosomal RNA small subunit methyltransferase A n=1 Tax=Hohaiivirga grylli TaxID=3133970 RepID=A0ABV0BK36_9HYPH